MTIGAGSDPCFLALLVPGVVNMLGSNRFRHKTPTHLAYQIVGELPLVLHVAVGTGGRRHASFVDVILKARVPVPVVLDDGLVHRAMLGEHVLLEFVVIDTVMAGGTGFRLA